MKQISHMTQRYMVNKQAKFEQIQPFKLCIDLSNSQLNTEDNLDIFFIVQILFPR
jgi:hypothetical protein